MPVESILYKKPFQSKNINKHKKWIENSSPLNQAHTNCHHKIINLQVGHHKKGKWLIHGPKHHKGNPVLSLENFCWLYLV